MCSLVLQDEGSSKPLIRPHEMISLTFLVRIELKRIEKGDRSRRKEREKVTEGGTASTKGEDVYPLGRSWNDICVFF